jgi:tRNA(Arg) A34 adenosine deaminase TadA
VRQHGSRSAWFLRTLAESFAHAREDDVQSASDELAAILRHQAPISLEEFVRDHRDAFADNALIYCTPEPCLMCACVCKAE